jgi:hypothetical protein
MFWPNIHDTVERGKPVTKEENKAKTLRKMKESLILEAYNYNDKARRMASANSMYMGSGATARLFHILGADWPKISIFNAMSNATDEQIQAALVFCKPYLDAAKRSKLTSINEVSIRYLKPGEPTDNVPHSVQRDWDMLEARFTEATTLKPDTTLKTRDGAKFGNAIAVRWVDNGAKIEIETDFGNRVTLTEGEILEHFRLGYHQPYTEWFDARLEKIKAAGEREKML